MPVEFEAGLLYNIEISFGFDDYCYINMRVTQPHTRTRCLGNLRANGFDFNCIWSEHLTGRVERRRLDSFMAALASDEVISPELSSKWETHRETILALEVGYKVIMGLSNVQNKFEMASAIMMANLQGHSGPRIIEQGVCIFPVGVLSANMQPAAPSVGFFSGPISRERQTPIIRGGGLVDPRLGIATTWVLPEERVYGIHAAHVSDAQLLARCGSGAVPLRMPDVGANAEKISELGISDEAIPEEFICPLSLSIMTDPVRLKDDPSGIVFERAFIEHWIHISHCHPLTRQSIALSNLQPDFELKAQIDAYIADLARARPHSII